MADDKFNNPFAILRGSLPEPPAAAPAAEPAPAPARRDPAARPIPRAVVRLERSGRGGKEVTIIEHLALQPREREPWLKALKAALGCGGVLEGDALVLQGDQRKRLPKLLEARGVKRITVA